MINKEPTLIQITELKQMLEWTFNELITNDFELIYYNNSQKPKNIRLHEDCIIG